MEKTIKNNVEEKPAITECSCYEKYDCCDCGGNDCGCAYCFSCNACEDCLNEE